MSLGLGFELWFVVGCFIADEYFFVSECFLRGDSEGWRSGLVGLIGWGDGCVLAEGVLTLARMRAPVPGVLFFLLSQVSQWMELKILHHPKNNVSFYWKRRVVLLKTTYRFTENNVLFYWKQRVVFDWRSKSCFEDGVLGFFLGRVVAWKCDSEGCCFWNQCKRLLHNELLNLCDTCDSKKHKTPVICAYARAYSAMLFRFLPSLAIARRLASSLSRPSRTSSLSRFSSSSSSSSSSSPSRKPPPLTSNL